MSNGLFDPERMALKALNRYQVLQSDCANVDASLHQLSNDQDCPMAVINGLNRDKTVSQIPYLKGYFFLYQSSLLVGMDNLLRALRGFVVKYHKCLVSTPEIVEFLSSSLDCSLSELSSTWLYSATLPPLIPTSNNRLIIEVHQHFGYWMRPQEGIAPVFASELAFPDQLVTLLDRLLSDCNPLPATKVFHRFINHYNPNLVNADTYHRICELIVAGRYTHYLHLVRTFLLNQPAMGAYLYGELMLTQLPFYTAIALESFQTLEPQLDYDFKSIVKDLLHL